MEETSKNLKDSPELRANFLSRIFYCWLNPLFKIGFKRTLQVDDVYGVLKQDSSKYLCDKLERHWETELKNYAANPSHPPSLRRALVRTFAVQYMLWGFVIFVEETVKIIQPILLGYLIRFFTPGSQIEPWEAYLFAAGISLCAIIPATTHHPYFLALFRFGAWARIGCCCLVYKKALRLSSSALRKATVGHIVNLMSNDVIRLDQSALFIHFIFLAPLEVIVVFVLLWYRIKWSAIAGMALIVLLLPVQAFFGRIFGFLRTKTAAHTDERVRLVNELLCAMRIVKMYCWELFFSKLISDVRKKEIRRILHANYARAVMMAPYFSANKFIAYFTFLTYFLTGNTLTAETVFVTISLFGPVRFAMTFCLPLGIQFAAEAKVALQRLEELLLLEEVDLKKPAIEEAVPSPEVRVSGLTATWDKSLPTNILQDISFEVGRGQLLAVIGPVGAGKSSLLMALLGELPLLNGSADVKGRVAYVSQQAWVFSASLRQNILFGLPYEDDKYRRVIRAAALTKDLELMAEGDKTLVGERGVSLSGGQKARVSLARALYSDADIYFLDDPLSAVDTQVGRHIFKRCICGLLKDKPRILVTHQIHYLESADRILVLKGDDGVRLGTYEELTHSGIDFQSLLKSDEDEQNKLEPEVLRLSPSHGHSDENQNPAKVKHSGLDAIGDQLSRSYKELHKMLGSSESDAETHQTLLTKTGDLKDSDKADGIHKKDQPNGTFDRTVSLVSLASTSSIAVFTEEGEFIPQAQEEEVRAGGSVKASLYVKYFYNGGGVIGLIILVLLNILAHTTYILSDWWLAYWCQVIALQSAQVNTTVYFNSSVFGDNTTLSGDALSPATGPPIVAGPFEDEMMYLHVFTGLTAAVLLFGLLRAVQAFDVFVRSAKFLHVKMLNAILHCPMLFFDANPVGRILNRFSKDLGQIEEILPFFMYDFLQSALLVIGVILVVGIINPWIFIATIPCCIVFVLIRYYYLRTARSLKRLEATAKSPVFSHISSTVLGLQTIRAYRAEQTFNSEFNSHQDMHTAVSYLFFVTSRWFAVRLEYLCAFFITAVAFCSVLAASTLDPGLVGLSLSYAITMMQLFQWTVRQSTEVESLMTSVERIVEYSELPSEAAFEHRKHKKLPANWPTSGAIAAENMSLQYNENSPVVLKNLTFNINDKEKIGIVGRTGAGKSSLITAFFRLAEPSGKLFIDGVDVTTLGLHDVRKKISIIPQDPVLLSGSLRKNLDPLNQYSDLQIWHALEQVQLKAMVNELPDGLESEIHEGGSNISMGQRQLVCLARAILKCNRILIIDEGTANVDPRTDELIQNTIREQFRHCTVLTIAHRLNTIVDSDRVMVLSEGQIVEFDRPSTLLLNPDSLFHNMAQQTGSEEFNRLLKLSQDVPNGPDHELFSDQQETSFQPVISSFLDQYKDDVVAV